MWLNKELVNTLSFPEAAKNKTLITSSQRKAKLLLSSQCDFVVFVDVIFHFILPCLPHWNEIRFGILHATTKSNCWYSNCIFNYSTSMNRKQWHFSYFVFNIIIIVFQWVLCLFHLFHVKMFKVLHSKYNYHTSIAFEE